VNVAPADVMHGLAAPAWQHLDAKHTLGLLPGPGFAPAVKLNELRDQMLDGVGCGVALGFLGLSFLGRRVDTLFQLMARFGRKPARGRERDLRPLAKRHLDRPAVEPPAISPRPASARL